MQKGILKEAYRMKGLLADDECLLLHRLAGETVARFGKDAVLCEIGLFHGKSTVSLHIPRLKTIRAVAKHTLGFFSIGVVFTIMDAVSRYFIVLLAGNTKVYGIFDCFCRLRSGKNR